MATIKVGLVDMETMFREGMVCQFSNAVGYKVSFAVDTTKQAGVKLRKGTTNVLIINIEQVLSCQLQCIRAIKMKHPELKIMVLTNYCSEVSLSLLRNEGVDGMVLKTKGFEHLLVGINYVFERGYFFDDVDLQQHIAINTADAVQLALWLAVQLTNRETEILPLLCDGLTNVQISVKLFISERTVEDHRENLMTKTKSINLAGLILYAVNMGNVCLLNSNVIRIAIPETPTTHTHHTFCTFVYHILIK